MYKIEKSEFENLVSATSFVELELGLQNTGSKDVKFYGLEAGKDVLLVSVFNCDICTGVNVLRDTHIVEYNGRYTVRPNYLLDVENDNVFFHPDFVGVMENDYDNDISGGYHVSQVNNSDDNILADQIAYDQGGFTSIGNMISKEDAQKIKESLTDLGKNISNIGKKATENITYEKISKQMDKTIKEVMPSIAADIVNPKVIKEIEPGFKKVQEELIKGQEEKPINPEPVVTTGRRVNKPEEKKKPEFKVQKKEKPQREVVRATDYVEPQPVEKGYWD